MSINKTCGPCVFKNNGCFVQSGFTKMSSDKLDANSLSMYPIEVIEEEVECIDKSFGGKEIPQDGARGGRDLRLHIGGDCYSAEGAMLLSKAASRWRARGGGRGWTYTHLWRVVPREAWGNDIAVLASCESIKDMQEAVRRGYAPAVVVDHFPSDLAFERGGIRIIPCPAETRGLTCVECRLCFNDRRLHNTNRAIGFAVHGHGSEKAKKVALQVL